MEHSYWLTALAWTSLAIAGACAVLILIGVLRHPQKMWIMNVVWPVTALYAGPLALWMYYRFGRLSERARAAEAKAEGRPEPAKEKPTWAAYAIAATHCGAGCTLADVLAEWGAFFFPAVLFWLGYGRLWNHKMFSAWVLDFIVAYLIGIAFQYFTIQPMRHLSIGRGLWQAIKVDTLSLVAWQVGMYGWMAVATFLIFHHELAKTGPVFWFMMQVAMLCGFATSYPVNAWLVGSGIKEKM